MPPELAPTGLALLELDGLAYKYSHGTVSAVTDNE